MTSYSPFFVRWEAAISECLAAPTREEQLRLYSLFWDEFDNGTGYVQPNYPLLQQMSDERLKSYLRLEHESVRAALSRFAQLCSV